MLIGNTMGSNNSKRGLNKAKDMPIICMQNKELLSSRANSRNTQRLIFSVHIIIDNKPIYSNNCDRILYEQTWKETVFKSFDYNGVR